MAPDDVPRLMICGDIELSWSDLASLAYRLCAYGVTWSICGLSVGKYIQLSDLPV